ncbi:hypothetical protein RB195_023522 [Necator americanus]|uniref:Uncharacterized protein n=1 Tax=Necator americanus TaxID=51031 RepID=A0ABR1EJI4_NECAM
MKSFATTLHSVTLNCRTMSSEFLPTALSRFQRKEKSPKEAVSSARSRKRIDIKEVEMARKNRVEGFHVYPKDENGKSGGDDRMAKTNKQQQKC